MENREKEREGEGEMRRWRKREKNNTGNEGKLEGGAFASQIL